MANASKLARRKGIVFMAYSVLGGVIDLTPQIVGSSKLKEIAAAHNVSAAYTAMKWVAQNEVPMVTRSTSAEHQASNLRLFSRSWSLTADEMSQLSALTEPAGTPSHWTFGVCADEDISER